MFYLPVSTRDPDSPSRSSRSRRARKDESDDIVMNNDDAAASAASTGTSASAAPAPMAPTPTPTSPGGNTPSWLDGFLGENPYFQAGFGLMAMGVGLTALRQGVTLSTTALQRKLLVSLEINNKDKAYEWFLAWMAHQSGNRASQTSRVARWTKSHQLSVETTVEQRKNGSSSAAFRLVAGPGNHYFRYNGAWMQMKRERETRSMQMMTGTPWETVTLTTLSRDRTLFTQLLQEARDLAMVNQQGKLVIHTAWGIEWRPFGQPRQKRPVRSVVLAEGVAEKIEEDIKAFLDRRQWYADRGIPYRRGYLLHGPPGSGKTSFIQALAGSLSYDICVLNLSERGLTDDKLFHLLSNVPERSFILMEDVDAAFNKRVQTSEDGYQSSVTFSGFLNALDGVASGEERIIFLTTNHLEKLDPALIRPGRVDLAELIDDAHPDQARTLFENFYGGGAPTSSGGEAQAEAPTPTATVATSTSSGLSSAELKELGESLVKLVKTEWDAGRRVSMAALQGHFIRNDARTAVETCVTLFR